MAFGEATIHEMTAGGPAYSRNPFMDMREGKMGIIRTVFQVIPKFVRRDLSDIGKTR